MARHGAKPLPGARLPALLRGLRLDAGLSQGQFGARVGVSEYIIRQVELGHQQPSQAVLDAYGALARGKQRCRYEGLL